MKMKMLIVLALFVSASAFAAECPLRFPVGTSYVPYCSNGKAGPAVFVIHGVNRNAKEYLSYLADLDTLVIAPEFQASGPGLYWSGGWSSGDKSQDAQRVSSFAVLDRMVEQFHGVAVVGHSAGGQFVTRYAAGTRMTGLTFIAANPGSYMWLDKTRPVANPCSGFNDYKYGRDSLNSYMSAGIAPDYAARRVYYLLGSLDTKRDSNLDGSCQADAQGLYRLARGKNFYANVLKVYPTTSHQLRVIAGVGHDGRKMLAASKLYLP